MVRYRFDSVRQVSSYKPQFSKRRSADIGMVIDVRVFANLNDVRVRETPYRE